MLDSKRTQASIFYKSLPGALYRAKGIMNIKFWTTYAVLLILGFALGALLGLLFIPSPYTVAWGI